MNVPEVLPRLTTALGQADIPYMLTGSFASAYYGSLRSTQDIDIVIGATASQLRAFTERLPENEYYTDVDAALEAQMRHSLFNIIDLKTGWKIDLIICKPRPFSQEEFNRRRLVSLEGISLFVASAEDVIVSKLEWSKLAQSQRQIEDVAGILRIRGLALDQPYLEKWVHELQLTKEWKDAQQRSKISNGTDSGAC